MDLPLRHLLDNTTKQNKNQYLVGYCALLVQCGVFKTVKISFLPAIEDGSVDVISPAGENEQVMVKRHPVCPYKRYASSAPWSNWPEHTWYGSGYHSTTSTIKSLTGTYKVPAVPGNTRGNSSAPWPNPPTLSFWLGVQGGYVLQPVVEWNGRMNARYSISSWNCCPAGSTWYSTPLEAEAGNSLTGSVVREGTDNVFEITTAHVGGKSTSLKANLNAFSWEAKWAEWKSESYYITDCKQWPKGAIQVESTHLTMMDKDFTTIPWREEFTTTDAGYTKPNCSGSVRWSADGALVRVLYDDA